LKTNKLYLRIIIALSIAIPVLVSFLIFTPFDLGFGGAWIKKIPAFNAILNSTTALCLILAVVSIKRKNIKLHSRFMLTGLLLGSLFLILYVLYHSNSVSVIYGDVNHDGVLDAQERLNVGAFRSVYIFTLLSHIALSIIVVPFVLMSFYFALTEQFDKHKKIVKYTFPIWLYVSVTGVIVYLMISPYYLWAQ
jgi:putative membrane protein